jgi:hypothetical protein
MNDVGKRVAAQFLAGTETLRELHQGEALRVAAGSVLDQLPETPVALLAASVEGAALAGVCAALRSDGSTWARVNLLTRDTINNALPIVFVEPTEPGAAWRAAVMARYPDATIVIPAAREVRITDQRDPANAAAAA